MYRSCFDKASFLQTILKSSACRLFYAHIVVLLSNVLFQDVASFFIQYYNNQYGFHCLLQKSYTYHRSTRKTYIELPLNSIELPLKPDTHSFIIIPLWLLCISKFYLFFFVLIVMYNTIELISDSLC